MKRPWTFTLYGKYFAVLLACLLLSSYVQQVNILLLNASMLVGLIIVGYWFSHRNLAGVTSRRRVPPAVHAGDPARVEWEVRAPARALPPLSLRLVEAGETLISTSQTAVLVPSIPPGQTVTIDQNIVFSRRGAAPLGPTTVVSQFPLGFWEMQRETEPACTVMVYPRLISVSDDFLPALAPMVGDVVSRDPWLALTQEEYRTVRDYRPGDQIKHVHWRTTARRGQLVVKEFEAGRTGQWVLIIDPFLPAAPTPQQTEDLELLISFAASANLQAQRRRQRQLVFAIAADPPFVATTEHHRDFLDACMTNLALLKGTPTDHLSPCLQALEPFVQPDTHLKILTTRSADSALPTAGPFAGRIGALSLPAGDLTPFLSVK